MKVMWIFIYYASTNVGTNWLAFWIGARVCSVNEHFIDIYSRYVAWVNVQKYLVFKF